MSATSPYTSNLYDTFISAWNTGSIGLDDLNDALKQISNNEDRAVASRLFYAIRRGWLHLHGGQLSPRLVAMASVPSVAACNASVPYSDRVPETCSRR
ncbi:hypothetical protein [Baaleninema sp.]|uniref:hypothetical protein n=1 Tax=Baaleninema sp. TaxID=3101197 RepID=UPI003D0398B1